MTLVSQIMTHKKQKSLIEMQADGEKLFQQVKQQGLPFFKWSDWISNHIEDSLKRFEQYRKSRLSKIAARGNTRLLERVEEKKKEEQESELLRSSTKKKK